MIIEKYKMSAKYILATFKVFMKWKKLKVLYVNIMVIYKISDDLEFKHLISKINHRMCDTVCFTVCLVITLCLLLTTVRHFINDICS